MTKEYGVTHFTELHRILHKYFLIRRCQKGVPLFFIKFDIETRKKYIIYANSDFERSERNSLHI